MIKTEHLTDAVICREDDTALEVSKIMRDTQRRHLVVLDKEDKPVGVVSAVDINNRIVAEEKDPKASKAKEIMTGDLKVVSVEDSYDKAYELMTGLGTYSIPVVKDGKMLGLLEFTRAFKIKNLGEEKK